MKHTVEFAKAIAQTEQVNQKNTTIGVHSGTDPFVYF